MMDLRMLSSPLPRKISLRRIALLKQAQFSYQPHRRIFISYRLQKVVDADAVAALPLQRLQAFMAAPRADGRRAEFLWSSPQPSAVEEEIVTAPGWRRP